MSGTLLAFDFGTKSIGVAVGQRITGTARPLTALKANDGTPDWNLIERLLKEWQPDSRCHLHRGQQSAHREYMNMRFSDLKQREVINCKDCKRLGFVSDMLFDSCNGKVEALIVPGPGKFFGCFCPCTEYVIPFCHIIRIGPDIILVDIDLVEALEKKKERI